MKQKTGFGKAVLVGVMVGTLALGMSTANAQLKPGDPRKLYPGADLLTRPRPAPQPGFTGGVNFIPGSGYNCGPGVIFVNNARCYVPSYYTAFNYNGGYGSYGYNNYNSGFSIGVQAGGLSLGYQQQNRNVYGYNNYNVQQVVPNRQGYNQNYNPGYSGTDNGYSDTSAGTSRRATQTPPRLKGENSAAVDESDEYYLNRKPSPLTKDPGLARAVTDIQTAFRSGNIGLLKTHLDAGVNLTLQSMGHSRRVLPVGDYVAMTEEAFKSIKTVRYALDHVEPAANGAWLVYGTHVLKADSGAEKTFNVGFVLAKSGEQGAEKWIITEVTADPAK